MSTTTKEKKKSLTIAQQAGYARRRLKNRGVETIRDYKGQDVPIDYVPDMDLVEHFLTQELIAEAQELQDRLRAFKYKVQQRGDTLYGQLMADNEVDASEIKNYTLSTFDKSLQVPFRKPPRYTQDEKELAISRDYKKKFFTDMAGDLEGWIIDLIEELMENTRGDIDPRKIGTLNKLAQKIRNKNFQQMVKHYNQSLEPYYAKRYEQFKVRNDQGDYDSIVLTYASLTPLDPEAEEEDDE